MISGKPARATFLAIELDDADGNERRELGFRFGRADVSGVVAVVEDDDFLGFGTESRLLVGEFAAHGGDDVRESGFVELEDRKESLDQNQAGLLLVFLGAVQVVEDEFLTKPFGKLVFQSRVSSSRRRSVP